LKSFLQKYRQTHWHVRIVSFVYHFCNPGTSFWPIVNANSKFTWTTADTVLVYKLFVFHCSWILGQYERNIVLIYILRASSLSCHDKIILFRILCFFGVEESIWSGITNPFLDSPKETHPRSYFLGKKFKPLLALLFNLIYSKCRHVCVWSSKISVNVFWCWEDPGNEVKTNLE